MTDQAATDELKRLAGEGEVHLRGDNVDVHLTVCGRNLVHVTREWLSFFASNPDEEINRRPLRGNE